MTVCIGAICDGGRAAVLAADRRITIDAPFIEFDGDASKITVLSPSASVAAFAASGRPHEANRILDPLLGSSDSLLIEELAERVRRSRERFRNLQIENTITRRILGISLKQFRQRAATETSTGFAEILKAMSQFKMNLQLLVAGVDAKGAHIFTVDDVQAIAVSNDHAGFTAIGSGGDQAYFALAHGDYGKSLPLADAMLRVYDAKRAAELVRGVGPRTDMVVMSPGRPARFVSEEAIDSLRMIYDETRKKSRMTAIQRKKIESHLDS
jgi:hypothetical protein